MFVRFILAMLRKESSLEKTEQFFAGITPGIFLVPLNAC